MKNTLTQSPCSMRPWCPCAAPLITALLLVIAVSPAAAQSVDFNSGNDAGWSHYSLPGPWAAVYSFPTDGSGGKAYKIYAPPTEADPYSLKNARAGSLRPDVIYSGRFSLGVDLLTWNSVWEQEAGFVFHFSDVGLGTSDGYTATYSSGYRNLYISSITDETPTTVGELGVGGVQLDPAHKYRMVVSTHDGYTFLFQLFDLAEPNNAVASVICQDFGYAAGVAGLFVFEQTYPSDTAGAEATFDNYLGQVPPPNTLPATVTDLTPPPAGKSTKVFPTVSVSIMDRDTSVDTTSILLNLDGVWLPLESLTIDSMVHKPENPGAAVKDFAGATVTYNISTLMPLGSKHTNTIVFKDHLAVWQTNTWTWTAAYPMLFASNSLPLGTLNVRGFDARMVQSENGGVNLANTLERARQQLAIPPLIPIDRAATSIVQALQWNKNGTPANVPGLCPGSYRNIAVETVGYLELAAGAHRFHIQSDDRAGVYSGTTLWDPNPQVLWENPDSTANTNFDFVVEAAGLYPFRILWEETGGSALLVIHSVDLNDQSQVVLNDPGDPQGVVKAWYPILCQASATPAGPFTASGAVVNALNLADIVGADCAPTVVGQMPAGGTFTLPIAGQAQFYRLNGPRSTRITNVEKVGSNLVITYQAL